MKPFFFYLTNTVYLLGFLVIILFTGCDDSPDDDRALGRFYIENLTLANYPKVDGSTSTEPLQILIASRLFNVECNWIYSPIMWWTEYPYHLAPAADKNPEVARFIFEKIHHFGTHSSFVNLINKYTDLILVARTASKDEIHLADSLEVNLIETPIALDAFIFLANINNTVNSLTTKQIQDIYTGQITRWNQVGGSDIRIQPYMRDRNSGSQELMESLVMKDLTMINLPDMIVEGMMGLVNRIEYDKNGLGYSVYFYTQFMIRSDSIKLLAVDGVFPEFTTLKNNEYPYTTDVYAVIRSDLDTTSTAFKLYQLLLTTQGQNVISESGYIPYY